MKPIFDMNDIRSVFTAEEGLSLESHYAKSTDICFHDYQIVFRLHKAP